MHDKVELMLTRHLNDVVRNAREVWKGDSTYSKALVGRLFLHGLLHERLDQLRELSSSDSECTQELCEAEDEVMEKFDVSKTGRSFLLSTLDDLVAEANLNESQVLK